MTKACIQPWRAGQTLGLALTAIVCALNIPVVGQLANSPGDPNEPPVVQSDSERRCVSN